ncbi:MAG: hypothetical protein ACR2NO_04450 [Chloroflexota bacterium]
MLLALRSLRAAAAEFFFDLPRMVLLNLFWFVTALPALGLAISTYLLTWPDRAAPPVLHIWLVPVWALVLALVGPGTAGIYFVTNRLANGELLEISRFWEGFRHFFWRGWGLALLDVGALALLAINVVFYWTLEGTLIKVLSLIFAYLLLIWFAIQGYLFPLLVQMDQPVLRVVRNALFLTLDNLGLTLGLLIVNLILVAASGPWTAALALPFLTLSLGSNAHNKVMVETVERYRVQGRIIADQ